MREIPPEIDTLLWRLAEEDNPIARDEFETRHARYGPELSRRIKMVEELRAAGKSVIHRPAFSPRPIRASPPPRWAVGGATVLAVLAVGTVAYLVASGTTRTLSPARSAPTPTPTPVVVRTPEHAPQIKVETVRPPENLSIPQEVPTPRPEPDYLTPRDVRVADTALTAAIQLVAAGGGLKVTVAPGFEDRRVTLDYRGLNTLDTLKAMGEEYGFTVLDEEEGHVLVVPVRENANRVPRIGG